MKVIGLITEYNPFHNGHLYHLEKSKEISESEYSVVVMSGNFVQRGEPALVDKWTRARMAIDNGVDLVIELPTVYAVQSAEFFAYGAVKLLDRLGIIDSIVFGSESGDISILKKIADVLVDEPKEYKKLLKHFIDLGNTFPKARSKALIEYFKLNNCETSNNLLDILSSPNNILAIEYLKALNRINSKIIPHTIKRLGASYHSKELVGNLSSASAIRNHLFKNGAFEQISNVIPFATLMYLNQFKEKYGSFNSFNNYTQVLFYLLRSKNKKSFKNILDIEEGLENRIKKCCFDCNSIDELLECLKTKRYTYTRLQRILLHILLNIDRESFLSLHKYGPLYIRVLGSNKKGLKILKKIKENSTLPIITKFADYQKVKDDLLKRMIKFDKDATNIYFLGLTNYNGNKSNLDYFTSPYIKLD